MRSTIAIAALISGALAFNKKICGGAGGCVQTTVAYPDPFRCPDGSLLNLQQEASNVLAATNGEYEIISKAQFPSSCLNGVKPGDSDVLVVRTTQFNQKLYGFIKETCTQKAPIKEDCYSQNPNPSSYTPCALIDSNGKACKMNPSAGECERWGTAAGRTQCEGWTPAKPEPPSTS
ncbi:hypothetical protein yc1106_04720 [Curvularia clavata]|uniref:Uncharacterized protein n=1 Tax=Curvularia clavata TaxID=95742 RepID=A0A9Q8Z819_CURCL|nr:hypothetical protein yc1106_04720 [Curvularia clavata]